MKKVLFLSLLSLFGKTTSENRILYRALSWADFRGPVPSNEIYVAARSMTQIELQTTEAGGIYHFRVVAYFLPDSSFVRVKSDANLRHEQTHFKITCIAARKCMKALAPLQGGQDVLEQAQKCYLEYFQYCSDRQDEFDREVDHCQNKEAEWVWEERISNELRTFGIPVKSKN